MAEFPTFTHFTEDSSLFNIDFEDNALRSPTDSGHEITRPRNTRPQRRIFTSGFTGMDHNQFTTLYNFYMLHTTHTAFGYTVPATGEWVLVKFKEPMKISWKGIGLTKRWDTRYTLKEQ